MIAAAEGVSCNADVVRLYTPPALVQHVTLVLAGEVESMGPLWVSCSAPASTRGALLGLVFGTSRLEGFENRARSAKPVCASSLTCSEMVQSLNKSGLSISTLAEILDVTRPTIYSWIDGNEPQSDKQARIETVFKLLGGVESKRLALFPKVWNRKLDESASLFEVLTSKVLREDDFWTALKSLDPLFQKLLSRDKKSKQEAARNVDLTLSAGIPILSDWDRMQAVGEETIDGTPV